MYLNSCTNYTYEHVVNKHERLSNPFQQSSEVLAPLEKDLQ